MEGCCIVPFLRRSNRSDTTSSFLPDRFNEFSITLLLHLNLHLISQIHSVIQASAQTIFTMCFKIKARIH
ncbi:MAG: hypothetical protein CSA82_01535 [Actinobacteria bacterium]|nr:MAG: hypothetical protein CSA82_01535 [Actinomycetota bacterium]